MRWRYIEPQTRADMNRRERTAQAIGRWWDAFQVNSGRLRDCFTKGTDFDVPAFMARHLGQVDPELMWEFGRGVIEGGHRLVVTPESSKSLRPMVESLLGQAPDLDGWEFYAYRLPEPHMVLEMVGARLGLELKALRGRAVRGNNNQIDLVYSSPDVDDLEQFFHVAFVATETLVGEEVLDTWIGEISGSVEDSGEWLTMTELAKQVERLQAAICAELPDVPAVAEGGVWTLFKLKPEVQDDYAYQSDLLVGRTPLEEMWKAAHRRVPFSSCRFSGVGETFCYIKLDGSEGLDCEGFADKSEIEDALDELLRPRGLGCQIGGGTGLRYSYVDLALTDVDSAIPAIRARLQEGRLPKRSWLLFFDDIYRDEWIGIWDDTPAPPTESD